MGATDQTRATVNTLFQALGHHRRRYLLHCLREFDNPLALADAADEVAIREKERPITEISAEEVKQVYCSLYHAHVPKLEEARLVQYHQERDEVYRVEGDDPLEGWEAYLDINQELEQ